MVITITGNASVQLGGTYRWSATGLTPFGEALVQLIWQLSDGSFVALEFAPNPFADANGAVLNKSFTVGTNIPVNTPLTFKVTDLTTGTFGQQTLTVYPPSTSTSTSITKYLIPIAAIAGATLLVGGAVYATRRKERKKK